MTAQADMSSNFRCGCGFLSPQEIEDLIVGQLVSARRSEFYRHVGADCSECGLLAADVEVFATLVRDGAQDAERREAERTSETIEARLRRSVHRQQRPVPRARRWRTSLAAAAVLAVSITGWFALHQNADPVVVLPDGSTLRLEGKPFHAPPTLRDQQPLAPLWREAQTAYEAGRFDRAERALAEIEKADPNHVDATVYRGVSLLLSERPGAAREVLERALRNAERQELATASISWFLALAALAEGDAAEATRKLESARRAGGSHAERAQSLLDRLKRPDPP